MSLVNLSHVCSHLQNASLAKLGLTSIPYTRLHLSLSLLLQKQGFLSQVKLGGASPPASCFPAGSLRQQHLSRFQQSTERVREDSEHLWKSKQQLEKDGWDSIAANFLMQYEGRPAEALKAEGLSEESINVLEAHASMLKEARAEVQKWMPPTDPPRGDTIEQRTLHQQQLARGRRNVESSRSKAQLLREGFSEQTLRHFAGPEESKRTYRDLARDGVTISAMGVDIHNQPWEPPESEDHDPDGLDAEGVVTQANRATRRLWLGLKYWDGVPVLRKARMLSKPTKRIWLNARELGGIVRGRGAFKEQIKPLTQVGEIMVISTDRGIMEVRECAERRIGGMPICRIW